jgi:hypothetical protein
MVCVSPANDGNWYLGYISDCNDNGLLVDVFLKDQYGQVKQHVYNVSYDRISLPW